jgi:hypothetical protein
MGVCVVIYFGTYIPSSGQVLGTFKCERMFISISVWYKCMYMYMYTHMCAHLMYICIYVPMVVNGGQLLLYQYTKKEIEIIQTTTRY